MTAPMQICPVADFVVRHPSCEKGLTAENAEKKLEISATFVDSAVNPVGSRDRRLRRLTSNGVKENEHCTQYEVKV